MLEFQTTEYFYKKYLKPGMKILDAGDGPGRYTVELARAGHHMTLLDVSDKELEVAHRKIKENNVENFVDAVDLGSITKLPYDDHAFDMVLCLGGPISHLKTEDERSRAIRELVRVARPGAVICVSVMNRPAVLNLTVNNWKDYIKGYGSGYDFWKEMDLLTREGDDNWFVGCSYAHFFQRVSRCITQNRYFHRKRFKLRYTYLLGRRKRVLNLCDKHIQLIYFFIYN